MKTTNLFLILFIVFISFKAIADEKTKISFNLYAGGLQGVSASFSIIKDKNSYELETITQTKGFIGFLYPVTATYTTKGKITDGKFIPQSYFSSSVSRGKETKTELFYNDNGRVIKRNHLRKGKSHSADVNVDKSFNEDLDYQTAIAMSLAQMEEEKNCEGSYIVFDGKRRYTMLFEDKGKSEVQKSRYSNFEGLANECLISLEPIGNDYPANSWFWHRSGTQGRQMPIKFWAKSFEKGKPIIPVKIEIDSLGFGSIIAHAVDF